MYQFSSPSLPKCTDFLPMYRFFWNGGNLVYFFIKDGSNLVYFLVWLKRKCRKVETSSSNKSISSSYETGLELAWTSFCAGSAQVLCTRAGWLSRLALRWAGLLWLSCSSWSWKANFWNLWKTFLLSVRLSW